MIESQYLKDNIQNLQKLMIIPPLRKLETENLKPLLRLSKIREYDHGESIIKEGDEDRWIYFLLYGKVRVEKEGVDIVIIDQIGEIFGEMRMLDGLARSASCFAEGKTICLGVDISATSRLSSEDDRASLLLLLYRTFTEYIAARLRLTSEELVRTKKELEALKAQTK